MKRTLIIAYALIGLFVANHYDAWTKQCMLPKPLPFVLFTGAVWPIFMGFVTYQDAAMNDSFKCPPGPYYLHHHDDY